VSWEIVLVDLETGDIQKVWESTNLFIMNKIQRNIVKFFKKIGKDKTYRVDYSPVEKTFERNYYDLPKYQPMDDNS